jgi:hypothetical protein
MLGRRGERRVTRNRACPQKVYAYTEWVRRAPSPPPPLQRPELTSDQRTELREAFDLFDSDKTGRIDLHELKAWLCLMYLITPSVLPCSAGAGPAQELRPHDGVCVCLCAHGQVLMRALGFNVKKQEVVKLVHEVDPHNNGTIDFDNFLEISESTGPAGTASDCV